MQIVSVQGNQHKEKQERDAQRCDRVKVLRYTNSLRAFKKLISGLTWPYTHHQDLAPPLTLSVMGYLTVIFSWGGGLKDPQPKTGLSLVRSS